MKLIDPNHTYIEAEHRSILTIWLVMSISLVVFLALTLFITSTADGDNRLIAILLVGFSVVQVTSSFTIKRKLLKGSVVKRDLQLVLRAYVVGMALCESAALLGVVSHFVTGSSYYYFSFGLAALGMLLHFPRKEHLLDALFKQ